MLKLHNDDIQKGQKILLKNWNKRKINKKFKDKLLMNDEVNKNVWDPSYYNV